jgi:hypothetical protein
MPGVHKSFHTDAANCAAQVNSTLAAQPMKKIVVMLIGSVLESQDGITFLRVEPIWLQLPDGEEGRASSMLAML